ncbi:MAG: hypothetical protein ORN58_00550, partial [Sediminibacterium sp.]|nr:hypothetical protein [Sediminibacterium sp.]
IQQIRLKNGNIQNFKHIFDIPTPYTIEDFMNKIYIPDPEKMPPILNRDIDLELELDFPY